uniref:Aa_trans domain-containing protein n=1 Tax=Steinernema glaseri TaxID=37863 RepID=A0A1I7ZB42_9BILA
MHDCRSYTVLPLSYHLHVAEEALRHLCRCFCWHTPSRETQIDILTIFRETDTEQERLLSEASSSSDELDGPPREISVQPMAAPADSNSGRIVLPIVTLLLPTLLSMYTDNVLLLATVTGSYPGVGVQFIIPSILVIGARAYVKKEMRTNVPSSKSSPFKAWFWPFAMLGWSVFTIFNVTVNLFHSSMH